MIDHLIIKTKKEVFSQREGIFTTPLMGEGYDFAQLREYDYHEDAKRIDWLISAKMQKPYVRVYQQERARNIVLVFLRSGSLFFGSKRLKVHTLIEAFLLVALSAMRTKERVVGIDGKAVPMESLGQIEGFAKAMEQDLIGTSLDTEVQKIFYQIPEPSLIIFLGDFLDKIDLRLFATKHDVVCFVARDSIERAKMDEYAQLVDCESLRQKSARLSGKSLQKYHSNIQRALDQNYATFAKSGIDWVELWDDDNIFVKLQQFFMGR